MAERAKVFGMRILWHNRTPSPDPAYRDLKPLLVQSDILSIHTPLNKQSHKLINAKKLALMRPNALLINMARGAVIDEAALVDALKSGIISGAALDVFEDEPQIHPGLLELENVILTPHAGGGARECRSRAREEACENVAAVLQGNSPLQPIFYLS